MPAREPFPAPGTKPRRLVFGELASIAELMAESARAGENADGTCACGCREQHRYYVSQTLWTLYGRGFDVIHFRSEACKTRWNQERRRREGR